MKRTILFLLGIGCVIGGGCAVDGLAQIAPWWVTILMGIIAGLLSYMFIRVSLVGTRKEVDKTITVSADQIISGTISACLDGI